MKHAPATAFDAQISTARHGRLFELIRQHRVAQNLSKASDNLNEETVVSEDFAAKFKKLASRSLRAPAVGHARARMLRHAI